MPPIFNFQTIRPVTHCGYVGSFIAVPAFSYEGPIWKGVSEAVVQYNYSADRNFVLKKRPTKPVEVNFCPVIRYRVGLVTYRYKLWQDVGERLAEPLYTGQLIKKNFVIEIWNVSTENAVSSDGFNVELGMRQVPDINYSDLSDQETDLSDTIEPSGMISNVLALPTTGLLSRYTAEGYAGSGILEDQVGSFDLAPNGILALDADFVNPNSTNGAFPAIEFGVGGFFSGGSPFAADAGSNTMLCLLKQQSFVANEIYFGALPVGAFAAQIVARTSAGNLAINVDGFYSLTFPFEDWVVVMLNMEPTLARAGIGLNFQVSKAENNPYAANFRIGGEGMLFSDMLVYNSLGDIEGAVNYLLTNRGFADAVPTEPSGDVAWLDNE